MKFMSTSFHIALSRMSQKLFMMSHQQLNIGSGYGLVPSMTDRQQAINLANVDPDQCHPAINP